MQMAAVFGIENDDRVTLGLGKSLWVHDLQNTADSASALP
jgi:hypothetical protein